MSDKSIFEIAKEVYGNPAYIEGLLASYTGRYELPRNTWRRRLARRIDEFACWLEEVAERLYR